MSNLQRLHTIEDTLKKISFAPSCVDMGWQWEVVFVEAPFTSHSGFLVRTTFQRPDRDTGKIERGFGRWWHLPSDATETAVIKTAYAAAKFILEHELMESFRYEGRRLFDPHHTVDDLSAAVEHRAESEAASR